MPDIFLGNIGKKQKTEAVTTAEKPVLKAENKEQIVSPESKYTHSRLHAFESYCESPSHVLFFDKLDQETLLLFLRKHFVTNVPWIITAVILTLIPFIIRVVLSLNVLSVFNISSIDFLPLSYVIMIILFYYFLVMGYIFVNYLTWFYNISLVTNKRIIDIDFSNVVFENVATTKLSQVEDVSYEQTGVVRSIFDYGDVLIQTAGATDQFVFSAVPHPEKVIKIISNLIGEANNA